MTFRILLVPGVNPDRWLRVWAERLRDVPVELVHASPDEAVPLLRSGGADVALVRLPAVGDDLSTMPLYTESTVVVVPKDHVFSVVEEIDATDLDDELLVVPLDDQLHWADAPGTRFAGDPVPTTADAVELVAAGVGVLVLPQSLGRLHQRRGLVARIVRDAPGSAVGLAWVTDRYDDLTEEFIGIVRGRTATSSRGRGAPAPEPTPAKTRGKGSGTGATGKSASGTSASGKAASGRGASGRKTPTKGSATPRARKPRPR
ncbi:LysR family transcriptional regulator substrate-binding protein [Cellulomonas sp.]|uniref:LysR family transcriptional regulator substrate-binding protein n=1 Tax=Cellulomonas sp. TaxID=40001 RepID=UPI003BA936C2